MVSGMKQKSSLNQAETGSRREFLKLGLGGLSLPALYQLQAAQAASAAAPAGNKERTAIILVWCRGGVSHLDTFDPKPEAPSDYRGPYSPIATKTEGLYLSDLLPRCAQISDKFTVLRSITHTGGGHPAGSLQVLGGDPDRVDKRKPKLPDWMSVTNYLRSQQGPRTNPLPAYVGINPPTSYNGPAYLGDAYSPFSVTGDPNAPKFVVPNIGLSDAREVRHLSRRASLRQNLDTLERAFDIAGNGYFRGTIVVVGDAGTCTRIRWIEAHRDIGGIGGAEIDQQPGKAALRGAQDGDVQVVLAHTGDLEQVFLRLFLDDLDHAGGRPVGIQLQCVADVALHRALRGLVGHDPHGDPRERRLDAERGELIGLLFDTISVRSGIIDKQDRARASGERDRRARCRWP